MWLKTKEQKIKIYKTLFALPRGKLCIRVRAMKDLSDKVSENEESIDGVHRMASSTAA